MTSLNPDHVRAVIAAINQGPYFKHLSMPVKEMGNRIFGCGTQDGS